VVEHLVVVDRREDWWLDEGSLRVISARQYLDDATLVRNNNVRVLNLCRDYSYLSIGYYCSLLGEARDHRVLPTVRNIQDLERNIIYGSEADELYGRVARALTKLQRNAESGQRFDVLLCFGQSSHKPLQEVGRRIFELFRIPMMRVSFEYRRQCWRIRRIDKVPLHKLDAAERLQFEQSLDSYLSRLWRKPRKRKQFDYDLAILHNPDEEFAPSNRRALVQFQRAGKALGINVELITRQDFGRLAEFDGLFIRETTAIDHHTYRFSRRAQREGIVVIDDPDSILRCANKVYLAELLTAHKIRTPKTQIVTRATLRTVDREMDYPIVLKIPDGSFSRGVYRVDDRAELLAVGRRMLAESELILAQAYCYTPFDWRIGVLNRQPIYACRYYMSREHWQIVNHTRQGEDHEGDADTLSVANVPPRVLKTALRAANLIGDGLYGVDLKETDVGVVVIEVNDNPSLDAGVEDLHLGKELYALVMREFLRRMSD
jgi:glutathione synthase/RimK-type ligase-like ATP-grasp enzyme